MCSHSGCHGYAGLLCGLTNVCFIRCGNKRAPAIAPLLAAWFICGLKLKDVEHNINKHYFGGSTENWALIKLSEIFFVSFPSSFDWSNTCEVTAKTKDQHFRRDSSLAWLVSIRGCWVGNKNCCVFLIGLCRLHTAEGGKHRSFAFYSHLNHILATSQHTHARAHIVRTFQLQTYNQWQANCVQNSIFCMRLKTHTQVE